MMGPQSHNPVSQQQCLLKARSLGFVWVVGMGYPACAFRIPLFRSGTIQARITSTPLVPVQERKGKQSHTNWNKGLIGRNRILRPRCIFLGAQCPGKPVH